MKIKHDKDTLKSYYVIFSTKDNKHIVSFLHKETTGKEITGLVWTVAIAEARMNVGKIWRVSLKVTIGGLMEERVRV